MRKPIIFIFVIAVILAGGAVYYFSRPAVKLEFERQALPTPEATVSSLGSQPSLAQQTEVIIKSQLNLNVPFTSQAPSGNWDAVHEEACEEASLLMSNRYFQSKNINGASDAEQAFQQIIAWEEQNLGFSDSTNAEETARIAREMLGLKTQIVKDPSVDEIKRALNEDKLILVPSAGRLLDNPFFKNPGPLYHMLVIKGYSATKFITNDPGTKNGADYRYSYQTVLEANKDWNNGDVQNGARVIIVLSK